MGKGLVDQGLREAGRAGVEVWWCKRLRSKGRYGWGKETLVTLPLRQLPIPHPRAHQADYQSHTRSPPLPRHAFENETHVTPRKKSNQKKPAHPKPSHLGTPPKAIAAQHHPTATPEETKHAGTWSGHGPRKEGNAQKPTSGATFSYAGTAMHFQGVAQTFGKRASEIQHGPVVHPVLQPSPRRREGWSGMGDGGSKKKSVFGCCYVFCAYLNCPLASENVDSGGDKLSTTDHEWKKKVSRLRIPAHQLPIPPVVACG